MDDETSENHREDHRELRPVVLTVGVRDRRDDEVRVDVRQHRPERQAVGVEDGTERNVADRADERRDTNVRTEGRWPRRWWP